MPWFWSVESLAFWFENMSCDWFPSKEEEKKSNLLSDWLTYLKWMVFEVQKEWYGMVVLILVYWARALIVWRCSCFCEIYTQSFPSCKEEIPTWCEDRRVSRYYHVKAALFNSHLQMQKQDIYVKETVIYNHNFTGAMIEADFLKAPFCILGNGKLRP